MKRFSLFCLGLISVWSISTPAFAQKLRLIVAADTADASVGEASKADADNFIAGVLGHIDSRNKSEPVVLTPAQMTSQNIINSVRNLPVNANDTIVFYFSGHGGFSANGRQMLSLKNGNDFVYRDDLLNTMKSRGVRLTVMITESCFNYVEAPPTTEKKYRTVKIYPGTAPLMRRLFFNVRGTVDMNSCRKGQKSLTFPDPKNGSLFTASFSNVVTINREEADLGWEDILSMVDQETTKEFKKIYTTGVTTQTGQGQNVRQRSQNPEFVTPLNVTKVVGPPDTEDPVTTEVVELEFNVKTGDVTQVTIRRTFYPSDNSTISRTTNREYLGKADLVYAKDGTPLWKYGGYIVVADRPSRPPENNTRRQLGITAQNLNGNAGVRITGVTPGSPATQVRDAKTGKGPMRLEAGDDIVRINGRNIRNTSDLVAAIKSSPATMRIRVRNYRDGSFLDVVTNLGGGMKPDPIPLPIPIPMPQPQFDRLGLIVKDTNKGVIISRVLRNGSAENLRDNVGNRIRLEVGDRILLIDGRPINSLAQYNNALRNAPRSFTIRVQDKGVGQIGTFRAMVN